MSASNRSLFALALLILGSFAAAGVSGDTAADPCSLLTPAEIQAAVGKPVQAGAPKVRRNPAAGADCTYVVGDSGSLNLLTRPRPSRETPEQVKADFAKMNLTATDAPGVGDGAFFISPAPGMVQLHAFTASRSLLMTLLVPGLNEDGQKAAAEKLMRLALDRVK